jgi:hypothetical protein
MTLSDFNRASLPESPEVSAMRAKASKFLEKHDAYHRGRECLQCYGNEPTGTTAARSTDYNLFTLANPDFLALFGDDSDGYIACRPLSHNGNGVRRLAKPVVWEVRNGHVNPPKAACEARYGMYIELGDLEYEFLWGDFTVKQWDKMVSNRTW